MVGIKVEITERMYESARPKITDLRHHHGQQGVGSDVEGHAQEKIGTALIKLAAEFAILDKELEQAVTGRQRHFLAFTHVPCAHNQTSAIGIFFDLFDE